MPRFLPPFPAGPDEDEVERVICASQATERNSVYATMEHIRAHALHHNPKAGIHVALVYQSGWFLHWAEGPKQAVNELFARIARDPRHHSQHVLHRSRGRRLLLTDWSMMLSPSQESFEHFEGRVLALREQMQRGVQYAPTSVIRRLIMPMQLGEAQDLSDPEAYHRVVICAAFGNSAFDLVRWLGEKYHVPKHSRRLAGETDLDSGSEYVEFMRGAYPCRAIAVARSNLSQGLHRSLVPDWRFLVLLFSGDPKRDTALLEKVHESFQGMPCVPDILAFAPDAEAFENVKRIAGEQGLECVLAGLVPDYDGPAIWQAVSERLEEVGEPTGSVWDVSGRMPLQ